MRTLLQAPTPAGTRSGRRMPLLAVTAGVLVTAVLIPVYRLQNLSWPEAVATSITFVAPCIFLGWAVWRLLMRRPRTRSLPAAFVMHLGMAAAFSIMWTIPLVGLVWLIRDEMSIGFLTGGAVWQLVWGLVIYFVLLLAAHAQQRLREQELAAAGAELQALRAQLDPHFLFNTLHSLTQLAREDPVATQDALQRFGEMMRYVLQSGRAAGAEVSLEEELEFVRNYLALERLRLGERLQIVERIDPEALELAVPPLLLQPLVENSVRHGLAPRREGGTLHLTAQVQQERLTIVVNDDGNGADTARLGGSQGLGLKAVARQLQAHFPKHSELAIDTRPRRGFEVKLSVPARLPHRGTRDAHDIRRG